MVKIIFFISYDTILDIKNGNYDMREESKSLANVQDWLNMPCVKFGKPAPKFVGPIKKKLAKFQSQMKKILSIQSLQNVEPTEFKSKKMSLDESWRRQNPI